MHEDLKQPHVAAAAFNLGLNRLKLSDELMAEKALRTALGNNLGIPIANYHLGSILKKRGDSSEAKVLFESFLAQSDSESMKAKAYFHLGELALKQKQFAKATQLIKECLAQLPQHQAALQLLRQLSWERH